jgi:hypothetical protein
MPLAEGSREAAWRAEQEWDGTGFDAADQAVAPAPENPR